MPLSLYRRGQTWHMRGTVAGQRIRESTGCRERKHAEAKAIRREQEIISRDTLGIGATLTFAEAALDYMQAGGEARFLRPLLEHFGPDTILAEIDNHKLQAAALALYPGRAPSTINRQVIAPVSAVYQRAADDLKVPARRFRRNKESAPRTRWLWPHEAEALLENAAPHLQPILAALLGTGARVSEILKAEARDWFPDTGEIWIAESKNGHARMVQMPARARDLVHRHAVLDGGPIFRTPKGAPYVIRSNGGGQMQTAFDNARTLAKLGPDVTPHILRHTWATWFSAQTKDWGRTLDLGGWRTPATAEKYRKAAPADLGQRLAKAGWNFHQLGDQLPPLGRDRLRVV